MGAALNDPEPLETLHQRRSSLAADGRRLKVRVGDVRGPFSRWRQRAFWALIAFYAAAPLIQVNGAPLIFLDILQRRFYLFGGTYNAQDAYLLFPFVAAGIVALFLATAVLGRLWCGWACPQTVFLEGVFRRIERLVEGPKHEQIRLENGPWGLRKLGLLGLKHGLYLLAALAVSHIFISYFVSFEQLRSWVLGDPKEHWTAFLWMGSITGALYLDFAWFREQTCLILCPYGRLQSALTDDDSLVIGYDGARGEPRAKRGTEGAGDCVDCLRCVDVCPTGIDIREGLQLDCVGCANCIDACDDVMAQLGRAKGLVRYDSLRGLQGKARRILRPRLYLYAFFLLAFSALGVAFMSGRRPFEATLLRQTGAPFVVENGQLRNAYMMHIFNKTNRRSEFAIEAQLPPGASALLPVPLLSLDSLDDRRLPLIVQMPLKEFRGEFDVTVVTRDKSDGRTVTSKLRFTGPVTPKPTAKAGPQ